MASGSKVAVANTSTYIQGCIDYNAYVSGGNIIVDVSFYMRRTNAYSGSTYSSTATPSIMISGSQAWSYTGGAGITVAGGQQNTWQGPYYSASRTYSAGYGGTTIYVGWRVTNDNSGYLNGSNYIGITLPTAYSAPATPTVSAAPASYNPSQAVQVTWGTSSFGTPSSGTVYLYGGTSSTPTTQLLNKTTTGNNIFVHNEPLVGNTNYYYRSRAYNGQLWSSYSAVASTTTYPAAPTITVNSIDYKNVTLAIASPSQGSALPMEIFYTVDGGTAISAGTITPGNSNTVNLTFLPNTTHTVNAYIQTTAGTSSVATNTFKTELPFYGSVNGQTKEITKLYGSVNGQTKLIDHLYGPAPKQILSSLTGEIREGGVGNLTAFDANEFYDAIEADATLKEAIIDNQEEVAYLVLNYYDSGANFALTIYFKDSSSVLVADSGDLADFGITTSYTADGDDYIDLTGSYSTVYVSKLIF